MNRVWKVALYEEDIGIDRTVSATQKWRGLNILMLFVMEVYLGVLRADVLKGARGPADALKKSEDTPCTMAGVCAEPLV